MLERYHARFLLFSSLLLLRRLQSMSDLQEFFGELVHSVLCLKCVILKSKQELKAFIRHCNLTMQLDFGDCKSKISLIHPEKLQSESFLVALSISCNEGRTLLLRTALKNQRRLKEKRRK